MEKLIIICTILIILTGAIIGALDAIYTHYQKKLMNIIKKQNDLLRKQNDILLENLSFEAAIINILAKSEDKKHE